MIDFLIEIDCITFYKTIKVQKIECNNNLLSLIRGCRKPLFIYVSLRPLFIADRGFFTI